MSSRLAVWFSRFAGRRRSPRVGHSMVIPRAITTTWIRNARPQTAAAMARPLSRPLIPAPIEDWATMGRGMGAAGALALAGAAAAGRERPAVGAPAGGAGALGAAAAAEGPAGAAAGAGRRTVGAAVGLGGRAIRTVSFFGWTLDASPGVGGTGELGGVSDICVGGS